MRFNPVSGHDNFTAVLDADCFEQQAEEALAAAHDFFTRRFAACDDEYRLKACRSASNSRLDINNIHVGVRRRSRTQYLFRSTEERRTRSVVGGRRGHHHNIGENDMTVRARLFMPKFNLLCSAALLITISAPAVAQDISADVAKTGNTVTVTANGMSVSSPTAPAPVDSALTTVGNALLTVTGGSSTGLGTGISGGDASITNGGTVVNSGALALAAASSSANNDFSIGGTSSVTPPSVTGAPSLPAPPTPPALPVPTPSLPALP